LLIVDDETHIRSVIAKALGLAGYHVEVAATGDEALAMLEHSYFDLMLLDILMPGMMGTEVLRRARELKPELLVIVLTGNASLESAIVAIKAAAADYLLKPTSIHGIIDAITKALQKRAAKAQKDYLDDVLGDAMDPMQQSEASSLLSPLAGEGWNQVVYANPLRLDRSKRIVEFIEGPDELEVVLSKGETAVLGSLMENPGKVLSCQQLVQASWGYKLDQIEAESIIRPYISRLRGKIEANPKKPVLIRTVRRRGYQFVTKKS
jgi:DNA-binding response OmpR family regulator